jgi:hypothetical protein
MAAARQALRLQPGGTAASVRGGGGEDALAVSEPTVEEQPRSAFVAIFQLPASSVGTTLEDGTIPTDPKLRDETAKAWPRIRIVFL